MMKVSGIGKYLALLTGLLLLLFSNGKWMVPMATWLSFILLLRFFRSKSSPWQILIGALAYIGVFCIAWQGLIAFPGVLYYVTAGGIGLVFLLPFGMDRLISPKLSGFLATLVFPLAWTTVEFIGFELSPFGTWGSLAYTQYGNLPFMQLASITGIYGLTFLITWFAAVANWMWEQDFAWPKVRKTVTTYVGVMVAVLLYGGMYLMFLSPGSHEVKVAGVQSDISEEALKPFNARLEAGDYSDATWNLYFTSISTVIDDLFAKSELAAKGGAKLVSWSENPAMIRKEDEPSFIGRAAQLAKKERVYLILSYSLSLGTDPTRAPQEKLWSTKVVIIDPAGDMVSTYRKTVLVPGTEATFAAGAHDEAVVVATPYGSISALICFDNDFPSFVSRQIGGKGVDILFDPSGDWKGIDPFHTNMMAFRAIENGFSVVRTTSLGLSAAYDYQGRPLATMDYFKTSDKVFTAYVPEKGIWTLYSRIGAVFAWLSVAGLVALIGYATLKSRASLG